MDKAYTQQIFIDDSEPALSAENLNILTGAVDEIDTRVVDLAGTVSGYDEAVSTKAVIASGYVSTPAIYTPDTAKVQMLNGINTAEVDCTDVFASGTVGATSGINTSGDIEADGDITAGGSLQAGDISATNNIVSVAGDMIASGKSFLSRTDFSLSAEIPGTVTDSAAEAIKALDVVGSSEQEAPEFEQGGISHTLNANYAACKVDNTARIRTTKLFQTTPGTDYVLACNSAYKVIVQVFDSDGLLVDTSGNNTWGNPQTVTGSYYWAIAICRADGAAITPSELSSVALTIDGATYTTPTPANPIPIVDADGEITSSTPNLLELDNSVNTQASSWTYSKLTASSVEGTKSSASSEFLSTFLVTFKAHLIKGKTYYVSGTFVGVTQTFLYTDKTWGTQIQSLGVNQSFTFSGETADVVVAFYIPASASVTVASVKNAMINEGTSALDYATKASNTIALPYNLRSIGDVHDEIVVNEDGSGSYIQRVGVVDLASLEWGYQSDYTRFNATVSDKVTSHSVRTENVLCNIYSCWSSGGSVSDVTDKSIYTGGTNTDIFIKDTSYTDTTSFLSMLSSTSAKLYYELATEVTTPLTSAQVSAILALQTYKTTTVFSCEVSGGVTYQGDLKAYIDNKLS